MRLPAVPLPPRGTAGFFCVKKAMMRTLPWLLVKLYRLVPARVRGHYPGFPTSTSHLFRYGDGWRTLAELVGDSKVPRPKMPHEVKGP